VDRIYRRFSREALPSRRRLSPNLIRFTPTTWNAEIQVESLLDPDSLIPSRPSSDSGRADRR
jgi:hypothetical protein